MRHQRGELLEPPGFRRGRVNVAEFREQELRTRGLADRFVAAILR
jgi:hypothetical protein